MPQPIEEGMVLGGRYLVTGHVLTSADQDMVLDGRDQVLNRDVAILVASADHASQVAASARELATGERQGSIQVLDLGLSEGRTYLIAGGTPSSDELLDMTREQQVYVEPFYTDTLGSEIFGEARTYEPHVYEDDEEYYEDLDDGFAEEDAEKRRPKFLRGISDRLSQRLGSDDAAREAVAGGAAGTGGAAAAAAARDRDESAGPEASDEYHDAGGTRPVDPYRSVVRRESGKPLPESVSDDDWTGAHDEVTVDPSRSEARSARSDRPEVNRPEVNRSVESRDEDADELAEDNTGEDSGLDTGPDTGETPTVAVAAPLIGRHSPKPGRDGGPNPADRPKVTLWDDADEDLENARDRDPDGYRAEDRVGDRRESRPAGRFDDDKRDGRTAAVGAGAGVVAGAGSAAGVGAGADYGHGHHHDSGHDDAEFDDEFHDEHYEDDEDRPHGARWLVGGILALLLILGAVFAFNILGNNRAPVADDETEEPGSSSPSSSQEQTQESQLPDPVIAGVTRAVPDSPELSAETDNTLPNAIDGNPATAWQTYSFAQPAFGGYASSMALVVELEEASAIEEVNITQNNGTGGSFSVMLGDSPDVGAARQIAEGSFTGPEVSVPVPAEDGGTAEAQYVIINFTELPQLSNASADLPYGLRIAEVEVE
ncbi:hypothetical protein [Citricoccus sp. GCM10030269]|uniref:hypothetical protein n=1 Tax=Citricoccus sp. GCM10030269 TaxID=3273388 RepID=UPI003610A943